MCVVTVSAWHDGGDEREPVGRRCDLPVAKARSRERARGIEEVCGDFRRNSPACPGDIDTERRDVFAFDDRQAVAAGKEMAPIVGRVELAPEMDVPAGRIAGAWVS